MLDGALSIGDEEEGSIAWFSPQEVAAKLLETEIRQMIRSRSFNLDEKAKRIKLKEQNGRK